jgi:hypothetical protein
MNSAVRMHHDIERELHGVDWADIGVRLTAYASWKARNLRWRTGRVDALAAGKTPEDLACEAILKVLDGERAWDPDRGALLPYLQGVVDSLLSHLAASADNRSQEPWTDAHDHAGEPPVPFDPDDRLERLCEGLRRDGQHGLLAIVDAIAAQCEPKPQALAVHLGTTVADINNRLKRLRRYAQRIAGASTR